MLNGCAHGALWQVSQVLRDGTLTGMSDRQILERFVEHRDERAFDALLLRHGPMVFNEGMTHESAAHQLGCPVGTVRSRLAKARGLLQERVSRRGMTFSGPALGAVLESNKLAVAIPTSSRTALMHLMLNLVSESAAASRGLGLTGSAAAILKGALHVLRIRIPTAFGTTMFAAGVLGVVIASRALVVGQTPSDTSASPAGGIGPRQLGPDSRPIGGGRQQATETFVKTYFVGDLIWANMSRPPEPASPTASSPTNVDAAKPRPDMKPLMRLIAFTVARDTWRIHDENGADVTAETLRADPITDRSAGASQVGSITPFYPSVSLIVRGTAETHARIGTLLQGLRAVVAARDRNGAFPALDHAPTGRPWQPKNELSSDHRAAPRGVGSLQALEDAFYKRLRRPTSC